MAKYSTGSSNSTDELDEDSVCEVCSTDSTLSIINISGATVIVCKECKGKYNTDKIKNDKNESQNSNTDDGKKWTEYATTSEPDNSWVNDSRPDYGNAKTPYLVNKYSKLFEKELYEQNIDKEALAKEIGLDVDIIQYILDNEAIRNDVSKRQISKIEKYLDINLQE
jgi:ribosome-binding protein aMBF1 (putative translation factor)